MKKKVFTLGLISTVTLLAGMPSTMGDTYFVGPNGQAEATFNAMNTIMPGYSARGSLAYSDPSVTYTMDIQYLQLSGNQAWFAGQVSAVVSGAGYNIGDWVLWQVRDMGNPGVGADVVSMENLTQAESIVSAGGALAKVQSLVPPASGPYVLTGGKVQVRQPATNQASK